MIGLKYSLILLLISQTGQIAFADHPNEGHMALSQLIAQAEQQSLDIKLAEENLNSLRLKQKSQYGQWLPHFSIESGPQISKHDEQKSNATSIYGKAEWNLYRGGADKNIYDFSQKEINIQERRLKSIKNKIKNEVSKIYYELQYILESVSLKKKAIEINSQQMKMARAKNKSGLTTSSDVLEFELRESTLQSDLVLLNQQLTTKSRELDVLLSRKNHSEPEVVKGHLIRENIHFNREELMTRLLENNDDLLAAQIELQQNISEKSQAESQFYPRLDFEALYGKLASDETVYNENNNYLIRLKLQIPLFSRFETISTVKSLHSKMTSTQIAIDQKNITLSNEIDAALADILALNTRLDLEEKNLERSEKYYKLTLDEYRRGIKNSPDMVSASERLLDARIRNLEYRRDLMLAKNKIQQLIGE